MCSLHVLRGCVLLTDHHRRPFLYECSSRFEALISLFHTCYTRSGGGAQHVLLCSGRTTYCLEDVLIHPGVAEWLEVSPVERGFACAWATAEKDYIDRIRLHERCRDCGTDVRTGWRIPCGLHVLGTYLQVSTLQLALEGKRLDQTSGRTVSLLPVESILREYETERQRSLRSLWTFLVYATIENARSGTHLSTHEWSFGTPGTASRPPASPTKNEFSRSTASADSRSLSSSNSCHIPVLGLRY